MGDPNYITPEGAKRLQEELGRLRSVERPKTVVEVADAAAQGDRSENAEYIYGKKRLREIDRRMRFLSKRLEAAVVIGGGEVRRGGDRSIFFGARVELEDGSGKTTRYRIVGEDEVDPARGDISWRSPLGTLLLKKQVGDEVVWKRPGGNVELAIVAVSYPPFSE